MEAFNFDLLAAAVRFETSCSSGPGGQHVNRTRSRVTACLVVSSVFNAEQAERIQLKLATRINQDGVLRVSAEASRSQDENKQQALETMRTLLRQALERARRRVPTKKTRASQQRRIDTKKQRSQCKRERGRFSDS